MPLPLQPQPQPQSQPQPQPQLRPFPLPPLSSAPRFQPLLPLPLPEPQLHPHPAVSLTLEPSADVIKATARHREARELIETERERLRENLAKERATPAMYVPTGEREVCTSQEAAFATVTRLRDATAARVTARYEAAHAARSNAVAAAAASAGQKFTDRVPSPLIELPRAPLGPALRHRFSVGVPTPPDDRPLIRASQQQQQQQINDSLLRSGAAFDENAPLPAALAAAAPASASASGSFGIANGYRSNVVRDPRSVSQETLTVAPPRVFLKRLVTNPAPAPIVPAAAAAAPLPVKQRRVSESSIASAASSVQSTGSRAKGGGHAGAGAGEGTGARGGRMGLDNLGNTCYMNSTLQCLAHVAPLTRAVMACALNTNKRNCVRGGFGGGGKNAVRAELRAEVVESLLRAYSRLLGQLEAGANGSVSPREVKGLCAQALTDHGTFDNYSQHDAHELLRFFLDALAEASNTVATRPRYVELVEDPRASDQDVAGLWWSTAAGIVASPIADLFRGQLRNTVVCSECGFCSRSFDLFEELMLPLTRGAQVRARMGAEPVRLQDALALTAAPETLQGADSWYCPSCAAPRRAEKQTGIWRAPRVLVLVLKRFYFSALRRCKVDTPVVVPPTLNLRPYFDALAPRAHLEPDATTYTLIGAINHMGDTYGGHYTADCRVGGLWCNFNDSRVSTSAPPKASSSPYILFYQLTATLD